VAWYDAVLVVGVLLWVVGMSFMWTRGMSLWEIAIGEDRRESIGFVLRRLGGPVLFVGALAHVIAQIR
jgi:hypothetical protein